MEHHIVCCSNLDNKESRHTKIGGISNVVLEKNVQNELQEHVTKDEVHSRAKEKRSILARITKQQKLWIGHNLRHPNNLLTLEIEGRFIGKRGQGTKRGTYRHIETQYLLMWYIMKLRNKREKSGQSIMTISLMNNLKQENNVIVNIMSLELL